MTDRHGGGGYNAKVRAELGGDAVVERKVDELKQVWPRQLVKHCDALLAAPMGDATFEALATAMQWRTEHGIPAYLERTKGRRGRRSVATRVVNNRRRARLTQRAMRRLKARHPEEYQAIYQEERTREASS